jgi:hypothetical protein
MTSEDRLIGKLKEIMGMIYNEVSLGRWYIYGCSYEKVDGGVHLTSIITEDQRQADLFNLENFFNRISLKKTDMNEDILYQDGDFSIESDCCSDEIPFIRIGVSNDYIGCDDLTNGANLKLIDRIGLELGLDIDLEEN